jgi:NADH-quinone oxidoreductase subunit C
VNDEALVARLAEVVPEGRAAAAYGVVTVDVPRERWVEAVTAVRDDDRLDGSFFDLLTGVDELDDGFDVVVRLWSVRHRHAVHLRTRCPRGDAVVPSLTGVFAGAAWHERQLAEMYGIDVAGHPDLRPLLLSDGFVGAPLRKDVLLAARVDRPWPGAKEPGESDRDLAGPRRRRRVQPPGVEAWTPAVES